MTKTRITNLGLGLRKGLPWITLDYGDPGAIPIPARTRWIYKGTKVRMYLEHSLYLDSYQPKSSTIIEETQRLTQPLAYCTLDFCQHEPPTLVRPYL